MGLIYLYLYLSVVTVLFHADGQTNTHDEANSRFSQFLRTRIETSLLHFASDGNRRRFSEHTILLPFPVPLSVWIYVFRCKLRRQLNAGIIWTLSVGLWLQLSSIVSDLKLICSSKQTNPSHSDINTQQICTVLLIDQTDSEVLVLAFVRKKDPCLHSPPPFLTLDVYFSPKAHHPPPQCARASSLTTFNDHTQTHHIR